MKIEITDLDAEILPRTGREILRAALAGNWNNIRLLRDCGDGQTFCLYEGIEISMPVKLAKPLLDEALAAIAAQKPTS